MRQPNAALAGLLLLCSCLLVSCGSSNSESDEVSELAKTGEGQPSTGTFDVNDALSRQQLANVIEQASHVDVAQIDKELARIRQDMIIDSYFESLFETAVDEAAVQSYYRDNVEDYQTSRVKLSHVLLRIPADASDEEQQSIATRAQEVIAKLRMGENFADVAKAFSEDENSAEQGGELGWVADGGIDPSVMQAAQALAADEVSKPLSTRYGIHIIKKLADTEQMQRPLQEVRAAIRQTLRAKAKEHALKQLASAD